MQVRQRHTDTSDHFDGPLTPFTTLTTLAHKSHKQHSDFSRMIFVPSVKQKTKKTTNRMRRFVGCKRLQKQISQHGIRNHIQTDKKKYKIKKKS